MPGQASDPRDLLAGSITGTTGPDDLEGKTTAQYRHDKLTWEPTDTASLGSAFVSGLASDPETRIRHFASQRFPDEPIDQAIARYGFDREGDLVFQDDDGKQYRELGNVGKFAQHAGELAPSVVGTAFGGAVGGPGGAIVGGAAGEGLRKTAATAFLGEPRDPAGDAVDMGLAGAAEGAGWWAGKGLSSYANRHRARDLGQADIPGAGDIIEKGKQFGIQLTPAEATDLQSLKGQQTYLSNTFGPAGDTMSRFYQARNEAIDKAVEKQLPAAPHLATAGAEAKPVFGKAMEEAYKARTAKATKLYEAVVRPDARLPEELMGPIAGDPFLADEIKAVKASKLAGMADYPDDSLPVLDAVKKRIDGQIQAAKADPTQRWEVSQLERRRKMVVEASDAAFPDYAKARAAFQEATPEVRTAEQSIEGIISKMSDKRLAQTADEIFSPTKNTAGPVQVGRAKALFEKQGKTGEWDNLLNAWLRKQWEAIPDRTGGTAAKFHDRIYGSETKRNILKAGMGDDRYQDFNNLMHVLAATTRVNKGQSITHFAGEAAKEARRKAAPVAGVLTSPSRPSALRDWWIDKRTGKYNETLADIITNPEAMTKLKELRKYAPGSEKAFKIVGTVLAGLGLQGTEDFLTPPAYAGSAKAGSNPRVESPPRR
ncbi:MAG: hypothetical protein ACREWG_03765 [Gammaproteobacteria bacterium]